MRGMEIKLDSIDILGSQGVLQSGSVAAFWGALSLNIYVELGCITITWFIINGS